MSSFLALVAAPFFDSSPTAPASPLGSLLDFVYVARRQVQSFFFNESPSARPVQIAQLDNGIITGTIGGADAEGDPRTYLVTQAPTKGTVVIDELGNYTYTANAALAAVGGADSFTVSVGDEAAGFHFHGLGDILNLGGLLTGFFGLPDPTNTTVGVAINVKPPNAAATIGVGQGPQAVALTPDGTRAYVANLDDNSVSVLDTATNTVIATIANVGNRPAGVVVGPAGRAYVANQFDDSVSVIDTTSNTVVGTIVLPMNSTPQALALNGTGSRLYVANANTNTVSVIDTATKMVVATVGVGVSPQGIAVSPDGTRAYVTNSRDATVAVLDTTTNTPTVVATIEVGADPQGVAVSPDGTKAYVTSLRDGNVSVIDTATNTLANKLVVGGSLDAIAVSADGTRLYVTDSARGAVFVLDPATKTLLASIDVGDTAPAIAVSADASKIYLPHLTGNTLSAIAVDPSAAPTGVSADEDRVETYRIYNLSDKPTTFTGYGTPYAPRQVLLGPKVGTVVQPGGSVSFSIDRFIFDDSGGFARPTVTPAYFNYGPADGTGTNTGLYNVKLYSGFLTSFNYARCSADPGRRCSGVDGDLGKTVVLLNAGGNVIDVPSGDPQLQGAVVTALCKDSRAICRFESTRSAQAFTDPKVLATSINRSFMTLVPPPSVAITDTQSQETSFMVSTKIGGQILSAINLEFMVTFGIKWTDTHTFTATVPIPSPPRSISTQSGSTPVFRIYGDFHITFLGSTYNLTDTFLDTPNNSGSISNLEYDTMPLPAQS